MLKHLHLPGKKATSLLVILIASTWLTGAIQADPVSPNTVLETASRQMISAINANHENIKSNPKIVNGLVEDILMPHIDFIASSKWV